MLSHILFAISFSSALFLGGLMGVQAGVSAFQFWPALSRKSWAYATYMWGFRAFIYPLIVLSIFEIRWPAALEDWVRMGAGLAVLITGFGLAARIIWSMGWKNAFGAHEGLCTSGWFAHSRNPIYVASWIGMAGWAVLIPSAWVLILLAVWAAFYAVSPFYEEPWLEQVYGEDYRAYKARVRRFI
ncbi:methyltransferase family protein [Woodsholea maritima]|uniref:methyltransferase family protein n=1 Tax=Woodsholea maritima TaxID=240237 RepID=UPI00036BABAB|nr:PEMT/PEM2 methyltransferase family protein [Woodsholea maritima]